MDVFACEFDPQDPLDTMMKGYNLKKMRTFIFLMKENKQNSLRNVETFKGNISTILPFGIPFFIIVFIFLLLKNAHTRGALQLCLAASKGVTVDGIVRNIRAHKERSKIGLKQLRIGGLWVTREQLEQLNYLLDGGLKQRSQTVKPRFYPSGHYADFALLPDDDRTIDLEACPKCGRVALVYDCTNESCQNQRDHTATECRACYLCTPRCDVCGKCIHGEYVDIYYLERRCLDCARTYGSDDWVELEIYKLPRISTRRIVV